MGQRIENLTKAFSDPKTRGIFITIFVILIIALSMGYFRLKVVKTTGAPSEARATSVPAIGSVPGVQQSSSEYVTLQEEQNARLAAEAAAKKTAAIPTVTRPTYLGSGVSNEESGSCSAEELQRARSAGVNVIELRCRGCSLAALKAVGFNAGELMAAGFSVKDLKDAGFTAAELKEAGASAKDLAKAGFSVRELAQLGYSPVELKDAGFSTADLKSAGIDDNSTVPEKKSCSVEELRKVRARGIQGAGLGDLQCGVAALRAAGFTVEELRSAGISAKDLRDAGFSVAELKGAGFNARELKDAGFSAGELKKAGFTADALKDAGFSATDLRKAGFSPQEIRRAGFSVSDMKKAGFSDGDLLRAGFTPQEVRKDDLAADVSKEAKSGSGAMDLKKAGLSDGDSLRAGSTVGKEVGGGEDETAGDNNAAAVGGGADWQRQLKDIREQQAQQVSAQEYRDKLNQTQQAMSSQAGDLFAAWMPLPAQQFVQNAETGKGGVAASLEKGGAAASAEAINKNVNVTKAGSIFFAVLDTGINSDEKSPVLATIVEGDLKGAKVLGSFERVDKRVLLQFNTLSVAGLPASLPLNAVAIDPNTARTALADHVDNHYLLRFGMAFASSFASGVGQAIQNSSNSVQINTPTGEKINLKGSMNATKAALTGLGEVGNRFSNLFAPLVNTPPTVEVKPGSGIGILLMADLSVPKKSGEDAAAAEALSKLERERV